MASDPEGFRRSFSYTQTVTAEGADDPRCCKIARVSAAYDLDGLDQELIRDWTGSGDTSSIRELTREVNERLLAQSLQDAGVISKDGEIEHLYHLLTDEAVSSADRIQARSELEREGVPVDSLESDFVSHQTLYNHLTDCLEVSRQPPTDRERLDSSRDKLGALQTRTGVVTEDTIDQLRRNDVVAIGDFEVFVSTTVTCTDCETQFRLEEFLDERQCSCFDD